MYVVVRKSKERVIKVTDEKKDLTEIIPQDKRISLEIMEVADHKEKTTAVYNSIYYVSDGLMHFLIHSQEMLLAKGDACFVEKGTTFELEGTFSVIILTHPSLYL